MRLYTLGNKRKETFYVTIQRQGNDKNGNPIYIVNIFRKSCVMPCNDETGLKLDKYDNIKITSYNIEKDVQSIVNNL